ncbi:CHASE2 domain-containing serine/threonine-protein kinase [Nodularia sp. NIES-3585]|uniref:CHASE2 domain-containing serine/threonine-protein kinase n=1 Tax=Nodularia sp. NIES-3585 TaxID=1973477 RepID=UPI000B6A7111|nr:CHASE2 domain-containing serine/threonine-protein kinase [Nodularia sp. NIES-3585]GAX37838.1 serine/threonine protein kinase with Chase2 sensor [Nodularia sp. NIES-3585]
MKYITHETRAIFIKTFKQSVIISSAISTLLILGMQRLQLLQTMELKVYDQMVQMRTDPGLDPRLLIVAVTEQDLQKWNWPLSGEVLDRLLGKLEEYEPRGIGLDVFRDLSVQPGHEKLLKRLQQSDLIIPVCKHADDKNPGVAPPQGVETARVGFSDIVEDTDGFIRRNLISVNVDESDSCRSPYSFSWQLALKYLEVGGIRPQLTPSQELQLRDVVFKPLESHFGGYENADTQGYQILLNYRSPTEIAQQVTLTEVLSGEIKPDLFKDRIVLIGSTAPSLKDVFNTPYTSGKADDFGRMAGIEIHGQIISQILSVVLNNQRLFWFLPGWGEVIWIGGWSVVGGFLAWRIRHPLGLGLAEATSLAVLFGGNFVIFTQSGWFPVVSPALGLVVASAGVLAHSTYQSKQEQEKIVARVQEQKDLIAQLQVYVSQNTGMPPTQVISTNLEDTVTTAPPSQNTDMPPTQVISTNLEDTVTTVPESQNTDMPPTYLISTNLEDTVTTTPESQNTDKPPTLSPHFLGQALGSHTLLKKRYQITESLASGGFGNTYLAQDIQRPRNPLCVVKQMRPASQNTQYLNVVRRLFNNEAYIMETLGKHQQIPQLLAFFEENQQFYLVQEFIAGHPLTQELISGVSCSRSEVINILKEVLQVLVFVHSYGVIHRDVKPSNLMRRTKDAQIVLIDFGAVKQVQPQLQHQDVENKTIAIGTTGYAPGEQMTGMPRFNSDIYALGIIAIQALTGGDPKVFRRDVNTGLIIVPTGSQTGEQIWQDWWKLADTTDELTRVLNKMVHIDFTQRYQSGIEVLNHISTNIR